MRYSIEPRTRKYVKGYEFLSFAKKYKKQLLDKGLDASKRVVHKAREYLGNKITDVITQISQTMIIMTPQTFAGLQDVFKTCLEDVFNTSSV